MSKQLLLTISAVCAYTFLFAVGGCLPGEFIPGTTALTASDPTEGEPVASSVLRQMTLLTEGEGTAWMEPADGICYENETIVLHAEPAEGWRFKYWKTSGVNVEIWFQLLWPQAVAVMNRDKTVIACFERIPVEYSLVVEASGSGSVVKDPAGATFAAGSSVSVEARPAVGWHFDHWEGDLTGTGNPAQITMDANKSVVAVFALDAPVTQVAQPVFSPSGGSLMSSTVDVSITCPTADATIRYTLDGSDPDETSPIYEGTFSLLVLSSRTVKARAYKSGMVPSDVATAIYSLTPQYNITTAVTGSGTIVLNPDATTHVEGTSVQFSAVGDPGWNFANWSGDLTGSVNPQTLTMDSDKSVTAVFVRDPNAFAPVFSPGDGSLFANTLNVTITSSAPDASIYYTTNGADPDPNSIPYTGSFSISATTTLKARAYVSGSPPSAIRSVTYTKMGKVAVPQISPPNGGFVYSLDIYMSTATSGANIYYTLDGSDPNDSSTLYTGSFPITAGGTVKARAYKSGMVPSDIASATYIQGAMGSTRWTFTTGGPIYSSPALAPDGTIYVGSADYKVYAINPDGSKKWEYTTGDMVGSSPSVGPDGTVYVGSNDGKLYALDPNTGSPKWSYTTGGAVGTTPAIGWDGSIYFGSLDNNVYAVNPNGSLLWTYTTGSWAEASASIGSDGTVYAGSADGYMYAFYPNDGHLKWKSALLDGQVEASPIISANGTLYVPTADTISDPNGPVGRTIYALNPITGATLWSSPLFPTSFTSSPAIRSDGTIVVGNDGGNLYVVNPVDGSVQRSFSTGAPVFSSPAVGSDGTVYFGSSNTTFYALMFDPNSIVTQWSYPVGYPVPSSPTVGPDGSVYVGALDGKLYVYYGTAPLADTPWPMFRHDPMHTGRVSTHNPPPVIDNISVTSNLVESNSGTLTISCTVTSEPNDPVTSVTVNLSSLGGSASQPMTFNSTTNRWEYSGSLYGPNTSGNNKVGITAWDDKDMSSHRYTTVYVAPYGYGY